MRETLSILAVSFMKYRRKASPNEIREEYERLQREKVNKHVLSYGFLGQLLT
jgi:hypothetical protein